MWFSPSKLPTSAGTQKDLQKHKQDCHAGNKFACDQCEFNTALYTDLWKHKLNHEGGPVDNIEQGELFINAIMAQQDLILQQLTEFKCNINGQMKELKQTVLETKNQLSSDFDLKMDKLSKSVSSFQMKQNQSQSHPSQSNQQMSVKEKILFVGDSLSRNLNMSVVKNVTDMDVKRAEAFIVAKDDPKARVPAKNFTEIVPRELEKESFSTLILQGGTNEVTNLDVSGKVEDKIEALKQEIKSSSEKMFDLAEKSLTENKSLKKVIILKRIFRCDTAQSDPTQIRNKLSEFGNRMLDDIWLTKGCPKNISIAQQPLECDGDLKVSRYGSPSVRGYDGIHMRGKLAVQHYTGSVINILLKSLPNLEKVSRMPINITLAPPNTYANILKRNIKPHQFRSNHRQNNKDYFYNPGYNFAQPQLVPGHAQYTGPNMQSRSTQNVPDRQYNVKTQNRFSELMSGN